MDNSQQLVARSTLIKNPDRKIKFRTFRDGGREHYHIGVWIEGTEELLDEIERVEYQLHPTFRKQIRESKARANNFSITFWAWGTFEVGVTAFLRNGETIHLTHRLSFELPADTGNNYIDVS